MSKTDIERISEMGEKIISILKSNGLNKDAAKLDDLLFDIVEHCEVRAMED